jgi:hypothetical protein
VKRREFHQTARTGKTRVWTIEVNGRFIHTSFGELGGRMQEVTDEGQLKNEGRKNEITPEQDALYLANRAILKKTRNGYRPVGERAQTEITWDGILPENLRFYKPDNSLSKALLKKVNDGSAWLGRKRDGEMMVIVKWPDGSADIVSRTMLPSHHLEVGEYTWNDRFVELIEEVEARDDIPPSSMILGDVVADPRDRMRWDVASFMKSKTAEARRLSPLFFYCWDIAWWDGEPLLASTKTRERYQLIWDTFADPLTRGWDPSSWILPIEVFEPAMIRRFVIPMLEPGEAKPADNVEAAMLYAKKLDWEGWVVVDPDMALGNKGFNFRGKTDRPGTASGKLKPAFEDDFIAKFDPDNGHGKWGRGNNRGMVGAVSLFQLNEAGEEVYICECGGGIDDDFRAKYSDPSVYPMVIRVEYTERTYISEGDKTNALTYPRVDAPRTDKSIDECINERL